MSDIYEDIGKLDHFQDYLRHISPIDLDVEVKGKIRGRQENRHIWFYIGW